MVSMIPISNIEQINLSASVQQQTFSQLAGVFQDVILDEGTQFYTSSCCCALFIVIITNILFVPSSISIYNANIEVNGCPFHHSSKMVHLK